jgi:hypothetical protein
MTTPDPQVVQLPQLVTVPDVEICAAGTWNLSTGQVTLTAEDFANAVQASQCPAVGSPVVKLGHIDPRFDGEPAVGRVVNMRQTGDGAKLTADLAGMPAWLAVALPSAYPQRSIEGMYGYQCQIGHKHPFVITGLALLGVEKPGVGVLSSLKDVAALYGVAASAGGQGSTWTLRMGEVMAADTATPSPAATVEDVRRAYYDNPATPPTCWITEIQLSPLQMIVANEVDGTLCRVPVTIGSDGAVTFGTPIPVQVAYVDQPAEEGKTAASAASPAGRALAIAAKLRGQADDQLAQLAAMRQVAAAWDGSLMEKNLGADPTQSQINALYAIPADTKSDSKLPHHDVSDDGVVGAADVDGVEAALAALNGARGGVTGVSDDVKQKAYNHLAAHYKDAGKTAPPLKAAAAGQVAALGGQPDGGGPNPGQQNPAGEGPPAGGPVHGQFVGTHSHAHSSYGAMGSETSSQTEADDQATAEQAHDHAHTHMGDNNHDHDHAATANGNVSAAAGHGHTEDVDMQFSDEQTAQIRSRLGLADDAELTPDMILAALQPAAAGVQASAQPAAGTGQPAPAASAPQAPAANGTGPAVNASAMPPGMAMVDQAALDELKRNAELGAEARAEQRRAYRDTTIAAAIQAGKTPPARREHWEKAWEVDPEGTEQILASLEPGLIPLAQVGTPGGEMPAKGGLTDYREYNALFGPAQDTK